MSGVLEVKNLSVIYRSLKSEKTIIKDISFSLKEEEITVIMGKSGSGKSTIGKAISGILSPSTAIEGQIIIDEKKYNLSNMGKEWKKIRGPLVGHIFQDPNSSLNPRRKIRQTFIDILVKSHGYSQAETMAKAEKLLLMLNFTNPDRILDSYPFQLSGGMCQRVSIALSLALEPKILVADEITSALDLKSQEELIELLEKIKHECKMAILFITHDRLLAEKIADKRLYLEEGKLKANESYCLKSFEEERYCQACSCTCKGRCILKIESLSKAYNKRQVLNNLDLEQEEGQTFGILGESGCGKSTLARHISFLEEGDEGCIYLQGVKQKDLLKSKGRNIYKDIQIIFQDERGCLNPYKKIIDIVKEPIERLNTSIKNPEQEAKKALDLVGIGEDLFHRRSPNLSTGQCQRVSIARALAIEPKLLVLDEVVSALDHDIKWQIIDLLREIKNKTQLSMLIISHEIEVMQALCDKIAFMEEGRIKKTIEVGETSMDEMKKFLLGESYV